MSSLKPSLLQAAPPARQRGVVLFIALIVMVALSLAAIALIRSVDTTTTVIGNLAFRQASILPANMAVEEAAAALFSDADVAGAIRIPNRDSNLPAEKGPGCDVRHRFSLSAVYAIPGVTAGAWARLLTSNWQISAIYQGQSGMPFTVSVFGDTANAGTVLGENPIRANYTGAPIFGPGTRTAAEWFDPAAFATPAAFTFGNAGRNSMYGPPLQTLDFALVRNFHLTERLNFQLRGEAFNAMNKVNLGTPNRFVNTPQFGTITMPMTPGRQLQIGARISF